MRSRTGVAAVLAAGIAATTLGGVAWSSNDANTIHACGKSGTGLVWVVADPAECNATEEALEWNIVGPQGEKGPKGDTGARGPAGVNAFRTVEVSYTFAPGEDRVVEASCPAGEIATGGGYEIENIDNHAKVNDPRNGVAGDVLSGAKHEIAFANRTEQFLVLRLRAVCVPGTMTFDPVIVVGGTSGPSGPGYPPQPSPSDTGGYPPQPSPSDDGSGGNTGPK